MLPLAEELGLGFTIEELRKYETRMKVMKLSLRDYAGLLAAFALTAAVIVTSYFQISPLFIFESVI